MKKRNVGVMTLAFLFLLPCVVRSFSYAVCFNMTDVVHKTQKEIKNIKNMLKNIQIYGILHSTSLTIVDNKAKKRGKKNISSEAVIGRKYAK